jgi:HEAT repeat protein
MKNIDWSLYKKQMNNPDPIQREEAIAILHHAEIRDDIIDRRLIEILNNDPCEKVRRAAIRFISEVGDLKFKNLLIKLLEDSDPIISNRALLGLKKLTQDILLKIKNNFLSNLHQ